MPRGGDLERPRLAAQGPLALPSAPSSQARRTAGNHWERALEGSMAGPPSCPPSCWASLAAVHLVGRSAAGRTLSLLKGGRGVSKSPSGWDAAAVRWCACQTFTWQLGWAD